MSSILHQSLLLIVVVCTLQSMSMAQNIQFPGQWDGSVRDFAGVINDPDYKMLSPNAFCKMAEMTCNAMLDRDSCTAKEFVCVGYDDNTCKGTNCTMLTTTTTTTTTTTEAASSHSPVERPTAALLTLVLAMMFRW